MPRSPLVFCRSSISAWPLALAASALFSAACTGSVSDDQGGIRGTGATGPNNTGGATTGSGGGGVNSGGATGSGSGGAVGSGGSTGSGGASASGGAGGRRTGGAGGTSSGGAIVTSTGGASTGAGGAAMVNCAGTLPAGGTAHTSSNAQGTAGGLSWSIWTNGAAGTITTFNAPAFSASWNNSGDYLARLGIEWGTTGKTFDQYPAITAQFAETKTGAGGGFSYVGIYGWSNNPCIEYYIIDDSYSRMPVNPGSTTNKGTAMIDGGTYTLYTRPTTGTGGSRCGASVGSWTQFYSVRQTARQCGQISISEHFKAWAAAGMALGNLLEAKVLIEVGGGVGSIDFTTANVTAQ